LSCLGQGGTTQSQVTERTLIFLTTRSVVKLILGFVTPDFVQGN
jgi:hypothetical protein